MKHLTYNEASSRLGLTPARIGQLVRAGKISAGPKVGRSKTVENSSLDSYARENNIETREEWAFSPRQIEEIKAMILDRESELRREFALILDKA